MSEIGQELDKAYQRYREELSNEDNLVDRRTTWLLTSQGLALAGFGALFAKQVDSGNEPSLDLFI